MSHKSKSTVTSMVAGLVVLVAYVLQALQRNQPGPEGPETLRSWALMMLVFIGIAVVALIIVQILFHVALAVGIAATEARGDSERVERIMSSSMAEDEMGRLIGLKAARVGYIFCGIGLIGALAAVVLGGSAVLALHILLGAFVAGSLTAGVVSIYATERGVRNG